mmetsp:Transcript_12238/g.10851  ORF Transcript_12238/g.10851 Transcript_12238/m.10851 type:complete len:228 (+) Transcript_12238:305-988(+)
MQIINLSFLISRKLKRQMDYEAENVILQFPVIASIIICICCTIGTLYMYIHIIGTYPLSLFNLTILISTICISIFIITICILSISEDSNILNGFILSPFLANTVRIILKKNTITIPNIPAATYSSTLQNLAKKAYGVQKRLSQYLSSFVLGGRTYSISGFFKFHKQENIVMMVVGIILIFSIPFTRFEWFNNGEEEEEIEKEKEKVDMAEEVSWQSRRNQSFYYFLN